MNRQDPETVIGPHNEDGTKFNAKTMKEMIQFNFQLDLSNLVIAAWVDRDEGKILVNDRTKVSYIDQTENGIEMIKQLTCIIEVYLEQNEHDDLSMLITASQLRKEQCLPNSVY